MIKEILEIPKIGQIFIHTKSSNLYEIYCISKSGDKESNQLFVTYKEAGKDNGQLFTRTLEDFQAVTSSGLHRFELYHRGEV